ncbi:MAG TPA: LysR family transcriptional regulator [Polyangiaceae bacterium]|nr:LysR family transcriptional regulator [Polyangiaceae bacterium]
MLDWDDLRYFLAVARSGSLSAASRALGVAQPTVGRRLSAFERSLGAKLLVATPAGQRLSPTGQRLLAHAEHMEREALAAERVASGRDSGLSGRLVITATEWMIRSVLGPLLAPFVAAHPALEIELFAEARHLSLVRRECDLAIRPSSFEQPEVVQYELGTLSFGLYASDAYLSRHGAPDFERQCEGHALIAMSESLRKIPDVAWLPQFASKARVVLRTNGREPMASMAAAGIGITCLPRFLGDATVGLRLLHPPAPAPQRSLWLGVHRDARSVPRVKASIQYLRQDLRRLQPALDPEPRSDSPTRANDL